MAIATLDAYKEKLGQPRQVVSINAAGATLAGRVNDLWAQSIPAGVAPTTAVVPTSATVGALGQSDSSTAQAILAARMSALNAGVFIICDRLSHQGGLAGNTSGSQTTNLPTAALTRSTSGVGVMLGVTIYTQLGATATTVTATYTNTADVGSRVTQAQAIGGGSNREAARCILLPLADGDLGVKSVQSVALAAGTGTVSTFGVTLFKPLYAIMVDPHSGILPAAGFITGCTGGGIPDIPNGACLFPLLIAGGGNSGAAGALLVAEH